MAGRGRPPSPRSAPRSSPARSTRARCASGGGADLLGDPRQQAVDETSAVLGGVLLRELDGLADHHGRRHLRLVRELEAAEPQHGPVHRRHAFDGPVLGVLAEQAVELGLVLLHTAQELLGVRVGRGGQVVQQLVGADRARLALVTEPERALPGLPTRRHYARARYSPVRVSTLRVSPTSMKSGTCTTSPVSIVAGFRAPDTRSPWMPGSVSLTTRSTDAGRSTPSTSPSHIGKMAESPSLRYFTASPSASVDTCIWS